MTATWSIGPEGTGGPRRVAVSGELDLADERSFVTDVDDVLRRSTSGVALDLSGVGFIDSSGLRALVRLRRDHGERVRITATSGAVARVLQMTGVDDLFDDSGAAPG